MSVAGEISEMPLPELLTVLAHRTGILKMQNVPFMSRLDVHIERGAITGCMVDDRSLRKDIQVLDKLVAVTASPSGTFRFTAVPETEIIRRLSLHVNRAAIEVASRVDEIMGNRTLFHAPEQIFRWNGNRPGNHDGDEGLLEFIVDAADVLKFGANADRLAGLVQLSIPQVQFYLLRLAASECIVPMTRDATWSRLDKTIETRTSEVRLAQKAEGTGTPGFKTGPLQPRKVPSSTGQKMVPILRSQLAKKPPDKGRITRLIK